jgi:hypothetical protein
MPNGKQAKQAGANKQQNGKGKQYTRREVLKSAAAAGAVVPLSSLLWQTGAQAQQTTPTLSLDPEKLARTSQIIERVTTDPAFRERVKAYPVEALAEMGIMLSPEAAEGFTMILKKGNDPDLLIKAMLGAPSPQQMKDLVDAALAPIATAAITQGAVVGVQSTTRVVVYVATGVVAHQVVTPDDPPDPPPPCGGAGYMPCG